MLAAALRQLRISAVNFRKDSSGSILPLFAVLTLLVIVMAGAGIDYGRAVNDRSVMAGALDSAALSVAAQLSSSVMTDSEIDIALKETFAANLKSLGYPDVAVEHLNYTVNPETGLINVSSSVGIPTSFVRLGGIGPEMITVSVESQATFSKYDVELSLVLDVTGSMRNDMDALKEASNALIDTLIPDGTAESDSKIRISIVPYSQGVNVGEYAQAVTNGNKGTRNCATERTGDAQFTDDPYDYAVDNPDYNTEEVAASYLGGGSNNCAATPQMEPLTAKRNKLTNAIRKLTATGRTAGQTGIQWGWYTLSPNWNNVWPSDSEAAEYNDDDILKFAVIMTDGNFNTYYNYEDVQTCSGPWWKQKCSTSQQWKEKYEYENDTNVSSTRAKALCEAMKQEGIDVYTIYFGSNSSAAGARVMKDCATNGSTFYMASSDTALIAAFGNIAKKVQAIYLSK